MYFIFFAPSISRTGLAEIDTMEQNSYDSASTLSQMMISTAHETVEATYQSDWGRIVATLIRSFGDFDVAEEAAQEAFAAATTQWPDEGVPDSPAAWIIQTAKHKAIDRLRRQTRFQEKSKPTPSKSIPPLKKPN